MIARSDPEAELKGLPDDADLARSLADLVQDPTLRMHRRESNVHRGAHSSEIIRCDGSEGALTLFIKYRVGRPRHTGHGYWGDVRYEGTIYHDILQRMPITSPSYYGVHETPAGDAWLVLGFVDGERLSIAPREAIVDAGRWLGAFHRLCAKAGAEAQVKRWDTSYFAGWAKRTRAFTADVWPNDHWIGLVCERFADCAAELAAAATAVVHGEFYPSNILVSNGAVYPVDWQSAAVGPGEIDLASLLENWGDCDVTRDCIDAYVQARWTDAAPDSFRRILALARVYWPLRWLGDDPAWTASPRRRHYVDELREAAVAAGLLEQSEATR